VTAPRVSGAVAVAPNKVLVTFDQAMNIDVVFTDTKSYSVLNTTVTNVTAVGTAVAELTLASEMISGTEMAVIVVGLVRNAALELINPSFRDASFVGVGVPPTVTAVNMATASSISVTFDQNISAGLSDFSFIGPSIVTTTAIQVVGAVATLTVEATLLHNGLYTIVCAGDIADDVGNVIEPQAVEFTAVGSQPQVSAVVFDADGTITVTYTKDMTVDLLLTSPGSYVISPNGVGAGPMYVTSVMVTGAREVLLTVGGGTNSGAYLLTVNALITDFGGNTIDPAAKSGTFTFAIASFAVAYAKAASANTVLIYFNRAVDNVADAVDTASYSIPGLTVLDATFVNGFIVLKTTTQGQNASYQVTVASLPDVAGNVSAVASLPFTGWTTTGNSAIAIYDFIFAGIRDTDDRAGSGLLHRLSDGWQEVWRSLVSLRESVRKQHNPLTIDTAHLPLALWAMGWDDDHAYFVASLTALQQRRLLTESPTLWASRGSETAYVDSVGLLTPARLVIRNWFWARWVLGDDWLGEDRSGWDIHILELPSYGSDEYVTQIMVVDDGTEKRKQIEHMLATMKPTSEVLQVAYVLFYSDFIDSDYSIFEGVGVPPITDLISGGELEITGDGTVLTVTDDVTDHVGYVRIELDGPGPGAIGPVFRWTDTDNTYRIELSISQVELTKVVGGVRTVLLTIPDTMLDAPITTGRAYGIRWQAIGDQIRVFVDGVDCGVAVDSAFVSGRVGMWAESPAIATISSIEIHPVPLESTTL
jgi:hypothetical protein